jgi:RNA polymerase sigma-70 factor (ECF subfamily)
LSAGKERRGIFVTDDSVPSSDDGNQSTSLSLLARVRRNEVAAWERFVSLYDGLIAHWCAQAGLREPQISDVKQEVFLAVHGHLGQFSKAAHDGSFRGWLRQITRNKAIDHWRKQAPEAAIGGTEALQRLNQLQADGNSEEVEAATREERQLVLRRAVELIRQDFEENTWRAFWRTVVDNLEAAEVAQELGITRNAVYLAKARVLHRLQEEFADLIEN